VETATWVRKADAEAEIEESRARLRSAGGHGAH